MLMASVLYEKNETSFRGVDGLYTKELSQLHDANGLTEEVLIQILDDWKFEYLGKLTIDCI